MGTMSPVSLGQRDEFVRADLAAVGMIPAQQGLGADQFTAFEVHDRLVDDAELVPLESMT